MNQIKSNGKPAGMSGWFKYVVGRWYWLLLFVVFLSPITISTRADSVSLSVKNKTEHFLHIIIEDKSYLFIGPEKTAVYSTEGSATLRITSFYSPGQDTTGLWTGEKSVTPYHGGTTGCSDNQSSDGGGCECSTNPAYGGSQTIEIWPDSLGAET